MKLSLLSLALAFLSISTSAQVFWTEDFETDGSGVRYNVGNVGDEFNDGTADHYGRTDGTNISGSYSGQSNSFFWAGEDLDDNGGNGINPKTLTFSTQDITGMTSIRLSGLFARGSAGGGGIDQADYLRVNYSIDGGAFQPAIWFSGMAGFNNGAFLDTDFDGTGDGTALTNTFSSFQFDIGNSSTAGTSIVIQVIMSMNSGSEEVAYDLLQLDDLSGAATCTASIAFNSASCDAVTGGVDPYTSTFDFLIGSETGTFSVTSDFGTPSPTTISADGTITVTGVDEGQAVTVTVSDGVDCNIQASSTAPDCTPIPPSVQFQATSSTVGEGDTSIDICVEIANPDPGASSSVDLIFDDAFSSATIVDDFGTSLTFGPSTGAIAGFFNYATTLTWNVGESAPICLTVTLVDDGDVEGDETAEFFLDNSNSGIAIDANSFHTLTIEDNDGPQPCPTAPTWEVVTTDDNPSATDGNNGEWTVDGTGFTANGFCGGCEDLVDTWLIYGPLDASAATALSLTFDAIEGFGVTDLNVQYSTDYASDPCPTNATWTSAAVISTDGAQVVDLAGAAGSTDIFIGIQYNDDGVDGYSDWILDNFVLVSDACPTVGAPVTSSCVICTTTLVASGATCDAMTTGTDAYTATFTYDASTELNDLTVTVIGGTTATTTVTAGTSGTIEVAGTEGTDITVDLDNSLCDLSATQTSPVCVPIPVASCGAGETSLVFDSFEGGTAATSVNPATYDTGSDVWAIRSSLDAITGANEGVEFWAMEDLENANGGGAFDHELVYDMTFTAGDYTSLNVSFYYYTDGYNGTDHLGYKYTSGTDPQVVVGQGQLESLSQNTGAWTQVTLSIPVDPAATTAQFILYGFQNGGDQYGGFDDLNICGSTVPACTATVLLNSVDCDANTSGTDTYTATFDFDASSETEDLTISVDPAPASQSTTTITAGSGPGQFTVTMPETTGSFTVTVSNTGCDIEVPVTGVTCDPLPQLTISEIMYNTSGTDDEWIEICNTGAINQPLVGFEVLYNAGVVYTFPLGTPDLPVGECITVALGDNGTAPYNPACGFTPDYTNGSGTNTLGNSSGTVTLTDGTNTVDEVSYDDGDGADGNDASLHVIDINADNSSTGSNWQQVFNGGSPGINSLSSICASNEDCADAIDITPSIWGIPAWETFPLGGNESLPDCLGDADADDDVWFSFTANSANDVVIAQDPSGSYDAVIEVFDGCEGTSLGCFNFYGAGAIEKALPGGLTPGQSYVFRVYNAATGASGSASVRVMVKTFEDSQLRNPSCGATGLTLGQVIYSENDGAGQLYSNPQVYVNGYAFRFQEQGGGLDVTIQQPATDGFYFQLVNAGLEYGKSYDVTVSHRVIFAANGTVDEYWSPFGTSCSISMAAAPPTTNLRAQYCTGEDEYYLSDQLLAEVVIGASDYRFTFVPSGPFNTLVEESANYAVNLQNVGSPGNRLLYGVSYTVTVEALVNGTWSAPGSSCVIFMSSQPEDTQVRPSYCGGTYDYPSSDFILAESVVGATAYEFQFNPQPSGMALTKVVNTVSFVFGPTSLPFEAGTTYNVQVRAYSGAASGDYVDTGCEITIDGPPMMDQENMTNNEEVKLNAMKSPLEYSLFPNPNNGTEFMVSKLEGVFSEGAVGLEILDITGKLIHSEMKAVKGDSRLLVNPTTDLGTGMYLLRITDEKRSQTIRFTVE